MGLIGLTFTPTRENQGHYIYVFMKNQEKTPQNIVGQLYNTHPCITVPVGIQAVVVERC